MQLIDIEDFDKQKSKQRSKWGIFKRYSSFASFSNELTIGYRNKFNLVRSNYTDLVAQEIRFAVVVK